MSLSTHTGFAFVAGWFCNASLLSSWCAGAPVQSRKLLTYQLQDGCLLSWWLCCFAGIASKSRIEASWQLWMMSASSTDSKMCCRPQSGCYHLLQLHCGMFSRLLAWICWMEEVGSHNGSIQELYLVKVKRAVRHDWSVVEGSAGVAMSTLLKSGTLKACCRIFQALQPNAMKK